MVAILSNFLVDYPFSFLVVVRFYKNISFAVVSLFYLELRALGGCFDTLIILNMYSSISLLSGFLLSTHGRHIKIGF